LPRRRDTAIRARSYSSKVEFACTSKNLEANWFFLDRLSRMIAISQ
jgi:hypothetical protein